MNQTQAIDYLWEQGFFEEYRQPKEITQKIWDLFKLNCSNIIMILKTRKYLVNKERFGWRQRYGPEKTDNKNKIHAVYIEAGKPVSALKEIGSILESLKGEIWICDTYFGIKSMLNVHKLSNAKNIKIVCGSVVGDSNAIINLIKDYNKEKNNLEVKVFDKTQLHDRYILTDQSLIILGHGLADLGNKESLVIVIPNKLIEDIVLDLKSRFIQKLKGSTILS